MHTVLFQRPPSTGIPVHLPSLPPLLHSPDIYKASCTAEGCTGNESTVQVRTHRILVDMKDLGCGNLAPAHLKSRQKQHGTHQPD